MRIGFDLDGVIAEDCVGFWSLSKDQPLEVFVQVCAFARVLLHPKNFMNQDDLGYIVTARDPRLKEVTLAWCGKNVQGLTVLFAEVPHWRDNSEWDKWEVACAIKKAELIDKLELDVFIDNNPITVDHLRDLCKHTKILLYGGGVRL